MEFVIERGDLRGKRSLNDTSECSAGQSKTPARKMRRLTCANHLTVALLVAWMKRNRIAITELARALKFSRKTLYNVMERAGEQPLRPIYSLAIMKLASDNGIPFEVPARSP